MNLTEEIINNLSYKEYNKYRNEIKLFYKQKRDKLAFLQRKQNIEKNFLGKKYLVI